MMTRKYGNHYITSLVEAEQRRGDIRVMPTRDRTNGFIEIPLETDPQRDERDQAEQICTLSRMQLQDLGAVTAEVVEIREGSHFIKLAYHIGNQKRTAEAFCTYADSLQTGDRLYVLVRERGRQQTIILLGLIPDQKRG